MSNLLDITELNDMVSQSVQDTFQTFNDEPFVQQTKNDYECDCLQQNQQTQQRQNQKYAGVEVTSQFVHQK